MDGEKTVSRKLNKGAMVGLITMALSWLIANKAYPWLPAWNEGLAFAATLILWIAAAVQTKKFQSSAPGIAWPLLVFVFLALVVVWGQYFAGLLIFSGDAFLISLYLSTFLIALHAGSLIAKSNDHKEWIIAFIATIATSAILSIGIALIQWTKTWDLAVFLMETDIGDRPGANLGQINNFSTLCFIAFCGILYLRNQGQLHLSSTILAGGFLTFGMAITQSRTGWLQIASIFLLTIFPSGNKKQKITTGLLSVTFAVWYMVIPWLQSTALLTADQQTRALPLHDVRLTMWSALLDASSIRPWFGYGWLQTGWAQQVTAETHPILRTYMSYSHNLALDLIVWNGWPIAIILLGLLFVWFFQNLSHRKRDDGNNYLYCAVLGVFIHGMLEYPLTYAYFLMPLGLIMGYLDGTQSNLVKCHFKWKQIVIFMFTTCILYFAICVDYINAVPLDVAVRLRSAQIGPRPEYNEQPTKFLVLNQLATMYAMRTMQEDEYAIEKNITLMAKVVQRYPYSPALFQYALANAMHGDRLVAETQLKVLCGIYTAAHCITIEKRWQIFQQKYPESVGLVIFPKMQ